MHELTRSWFQLHLEVAPGDVDAGEAWKIDWNQVWVDHHRIAEKYESACGINLRS